MFIIIWLAVLITLGFILAWIAALVTREDIEVKTGILTIICAGVLSFFAKLGFGNSLSEHEGIETILFIAMDYVILAACLRALAKLPWKGVFIIAAIYDALLFLVRLGISAMLDAP